MGVEEIDGHMNTRCVVKDMNRLLRKHLHCKGLNTHCSWFAVWMPPVSRVRRALSDGPITAPVSSLHLAGLESVSLPTFFRDSTKDTGVVPLLRPLFFQSYIDNILANRNSFEDLASRWALSLFEGLMLILFFFLYLSIPSVIVGT